LRLGLLEDDNQYHLAMQEASVSNSTSSLRSLFAVILTWCEPSNPLDIYEHHKESMVGDFLRLQCTWLDNVELGFNEDFLTWLLMTCRIGYFQWEADNCQCMAYHSLKL